MLSIFFFKQKTAYEMRISDWSSDVCSSDLSDHGHASIRELLRPAVLIPESKKLNVLLREFRQSRNHMAIVIDEYGGVAGLVTIEEIGRAPCGARVCPYV